MWMARCLPAVAVAVAAGSAGCSSSDRPPPERATATATRAAPGAPFRGLRVNARVVPREGNPRTVFHVRFRPRQFVGRRAHALHDYEAHLRAEHDRASCIIDTGAYLDPRHPRRGITLDPAEQMGNRWCRDRFRGSVIYYRAYSCPIHGSCDAPASPRDRRRRVARIAFTVR